MKKKLYFDKCKTDELERLFGLRREKNNPEFLDWLSARHPYPSKMEEFIEGLRERLEIHRTYWNEIELRTRFIGPLLELVGFTGQGYNAFGGRPLSAVIGEFKLEGKPDWMVATGTSAPQKPYFFLHEYKQLHVGSPDPQGQLLAAMLAAQIQNDDKLPVYGCYTVAHTWTFVLLSEKTFSVSQSYDASDKEEIQIVWSILQETKNRIEQRVKEQTS